MNNRVEWHEVARFEDNGVVVQVNCLLFRVPKYSVTVSFEPVGRAPTRFIPIRAEAKLGQVKVEQFPAVIGAALERARELIVNNLQAVADQEIEDSLEKEQRDLVKGPKPIKGLSGGPGSGKTARRRAAKHANRITQV